jgi:hypothetical protein
MSTTITIKRPTNRRIENPVDSDYAELMSFSLDKLSAQYTGSLLAMSAEDICDELFTATNAPEEFLTKLQKFFRDIYTNELIKCPNKEINFFSMSVNDIVKFDRSYEDIDYRSSEEYTCESVGWTKRSLSHLLAPVEA